MPASNLIERVADVIGSAVSSGPASVRAELEALGARIREPVRIAVVGPVNSGKSTIVNALLGQRVAPTDVSECTRLVSWFRYGHPQRIEVELNDGSRVAAQLDRDGTLPKQLPVPFEQVRSLQCYLANDALRTITLIDTPGLGSVHRDYSAATTSLLKSTQDSAEASEHADAVVFLFSQVMLQDDYETLQLFRTSTGPDAQRSAASVVGVLSKADQLGDGSQDVWHVALELATTYAGRFRDDVATVVPVIGLMAETAEAATLTEADVNRLVALAGMDEKKFERLLWSTDRFVTAEAPVSEGDRERLLTMLDLYGIGHAVGLLRQETVGAVALRRQLSARSGIAHVKHALDTYFREQDHVLKVRSALDRLDRISYSEPAHPGLGELRDAIEALRLDPEMHPVVELEAWHECCTGKVPFPPAVLEELSRLWSPGPAASKLGVDNTQEAMVQAARDGMVRWQKFMVTDATPGQAQVARVARRSYQLIWTGLQ